MNDHATNTTNVTETKKREILQNEANGAGIDASASFDALAGELRILASAMQHDDGLVEVTDFGFAIERLAARVEIVGEWAYAEDQRRITESNALHLFKIKAEALAADVLANRKTPADLVAFVLGRDPEAPEPSPPAKSGSRIRAAAKVTKTKVAK